MGVSIRRALLFLMIQVLFMIGYSNAAKCDSNSTETPQMTASFELSGLESQIYDMQITQTALYFCSLNGSRFKVSLTTSDYALSWGFKFGVYSNTLALSHDGSYLISTGYWEN